MENLTQQLLQREKQLYSPHAAFSEKNSRRSSLQQETQPPYKRDVEAILHSKAYARYVDKTQVVYLVQQDHLTRRGLHVQLVSHFARGIAETLGLNVDLVEAIALAHDVGHPPFGHEGEHYLSTLSQEYGEQCFAHPWQSCRLLSLIEPLNLSLAVYDGMLCHDGGIHTTYLHPRFGKSWQDFEVDLDKKLKNSESDFLPATLEGCLVKICDTMSYLGRDIEDAIKLGLVQRAQIPHTHLGSTNQEILRHLAQDIITHSYGKDRIAFSQESLQALQQLRTFNFEHIYLHKKLKIESHKIERAYRLLFEFLLKDHLDKNKQSYLHLHFLHNKPSSYTECLTPARAVIDFISGMTDSFFLKTLQSIMLPKEIEWSCD